MLPGRGVVVGLGGNRDSPARHVRQALLELDGVAEFENLRHSRLYRSRPTGPQDQLDFINAVAHFRGALAALRVLGRSQEIEQRNGRVRGPQRWGARTLDLDLLLYGDAVIPEERWRVLHPGIRERAFVLHPLYELAPELAIPSVGKLSELATRGADNGLEPL
jgi:2-amino-4-hydroxy-6-hydroxymethyldihydropteridine diphosphokinase